MPGDAEGARCDPNEAPQMLCERCCVIASPASSHFQAAASAHSQSRLDSGASKTRLRKELIASALRATAARPKSSRHSVSQSRQPSRPIMIGKPQTPSIPSTAPASFTWPCTRRLSAVSAATISCSVALAVAFGVERMLCAVIAGRRCGHRGARDRSRHRRRRAGPRPRRYSTSPIRSVTCVISGIPMALALSRASDA